ncbi:MoaD/ThiS family protein [Novosphingobium sp.]|jgi:molybdopterin synthase sulfur carrier subunit|uniref:MoaD/ThiS family protein n=1 Tax=unclassified Novosphingobium TaxID=2644732 RepID=UPI0028D401B1|nr:MoaD/ThiS family protein [uncultured Novosphingobium sp.]
MALELVFLGRLEDLAGSSGRVVPFAPSLAAVIAALEPDLSAAVKEPRIRYAVNGTLVQGDVELREGDEVAFLPPVSGG